MATLPEQLGHYNIVSALGAGGMGEVYLAQDTRLNRQVAIKVLLPGSLADEDSNRRMLREARLVATIDHPNVCTIYDIGEENERPYIVMQYIQGETLLDRMERGSLNLTEAIDIARQIASALVEAHSRGIVHRDIKPGNVMISSTGLVKVLDFGLAKSFLLAADDATEVLISTPGLVAGTISYMSPEQLLAEPVDGRSDLFSLGVVLYEIVTGRRPFDRVTIAATISAIMNTNPAPIESSDLAALGPIISRALAKKPERRFATAQAMYDALGSVSKTRQRAPRSTRAEKGSAPVAATTRKRVRKGPVADPAAVRLYLRGRSQWNKRNPDAVRQAIALFNEAIEIDPMHASSYAGLADAYAMLGFLQVIAPRDVLPKAKAAALRAIELEPTLAEPHATLGYLAGTFEWDWPMAERELSEAIRLNPAYPWAPHWLGMLAAPKSLDDALTYVTLARDLDPLSPIIATAVGIMQHLRRDYPAALRTYRQILDAESAFAPAHYYIGLTFEQMGQFEAATSNFQRAAEIASRGSLFLGALGHCYAVSGKADLALSLLAELREQDAQRYVSPYNSMLIYLGLGDMDVTLEWFGKALQEQSSGLWLTSVEPRFDALRADERFRELISRHGLEG